MNLVMRVEEGSSTPQMYVGNYHRYAIYSCKVLAV